MFTKSTSDQGTQRDQGGETSTVPSETKEAYGQSRADHDALDTEHDQRSLKERVDSALSQASEDGEDVPAGQRAEELMEEGFMVGRQGADYHDLAARRQP